MNYNLQPSFEAFWKNFDPNQRWNNDAKKMIHDLYNLVRRINFEAQEFHDPDQAHLRKRLGGYQR